MNRAAPLLCAAILAIILVSQGLTPLTAQTVSGSNDPAQARSALEIARAQQRNARLRAEQLEEESRRAGAASAQARIDAAALAARVQQAEASVATAQAELAIVERDRRALSRDLAQRREPLAKLTGALETMARRPLVLSAFQPGSLRDVVHTRAVLSSAIPVVRRRTAGLRADLERVRGLEQERADFLADRREAEQSLAQRRRDMLALAEQERILAERATGGAAREAERALELANEASDLGVLVARLEDAAATRARLAALEGPVARPPDAASASMPGRSAASSNSPRSLESYILPVAGRVTAGFGEIEAGGARRNGIAIAARPQAQIVAPAAGRVAFAGDYEGYGQIAIIEHDGGWTSLVTGMGGLSVRTGQEVTNGSPLGLAAARNPQIELELRRSGRPVNPLDHLR